MPPRSTRSFDRSAFGRVLCSLLCAVAFAACSDGSLAPEQAASVSLSITASVSGAMDDGATPAGVAFADGHHLLSLQRVTLVVGAVTLREAGVEDCVAGADPVPGCALLERGPVLLEAPLDGSVRSLVAALVRPGSYDALGLTIHAPDRTDARDSTFLQRHDDFEGISVRVEGLWDGEPFIFERTLDEERWVDVTPFRVESGRTANITLRLDPSSWFRSESGLLVDPRAASLDPEAAAAVESRIRTSIAAFEDDDVDGIADSS